MFRWVDRHGRLRSKRLQPQAVTALVRARTGHAGLATLAAVAGIEERVIMRTIRHPSTTTLRRYSRENSLWKNNLAREVGL